MAINWARRFQQSVLRARGRVVKHARRLWLHVEESVGSFRKVMTQRIGPLASAHLSELLVQADRVEVSVSPDVKLGGGLIVVLLEGRFSSLDSGVTADVLWLDFLSRGELCSCGQRCDGN